MLHGGLRPSGLIMPPKPFDNILFQAASELTGGFVTDAKTALLAGVLLGFIVFGSDILIEWFQSIIVTRKSKGHLANARLAFGMRDASAAGSFEYNYYNALYRKHLSSSVALKGNLFIGKGFDSQKDSEEYADTPFDGMVGERKSDGFAELFHPSVSSFGGKESRSSSFDDDPGPSDDGRPFWS